MKSSTRTLLMVGALLVAAFVIMRNFCPASGVALTRSRRSIHRLKNRIYVPKPNDFDGRVTLSSLLQPGADRSRWSDTRAARVEGYVVAVALGPLEAANCYCRRDIHIIVAPRGDAAAREQVVLEVTPRFDLPEEQKTDAVQADVAKIVPGRDWSVPSLSQLLIGHRVRFEGWLFFDLQHMDQSENTAPGRTDDWRATAWELHPITRIEILK